MSNRSEGGRHKCGEGVLVTLSFLLVLFPTQALALDPDIFGIEVGNRSTNLGPSYTTVQEYVGVDNVTFWPTITYVVEESRNGILEAIGWMERAPQDVNLWAFPGKMTKVNSLLSSFQMG